MGHTAGNGEGRCEDTRRTIDPPEPRGERLVDRRHQPHPHWDAIAHQHSCWSDDQNTEDGPHQEWSTVEPHGEGREPERQEPEVAPEQNGPQDERQSCL